MHYLPTCCSSALCLPLLPSHLLLLLLLQTYLAAGRRNSLSEAASGYWELHIKEDERHGQQMLEEVALPLVDM